MTEDDDMLHLPLREARDTFEARYLQARLQGCAGNVTRMAAAIGMERTALHRKLRQLGIETGVSGEESR